MNEKKTILRIAIDGPSGAGKSTVAKQVAHDLGIDYIDTGAMYRAIGWKVEQQKINLKNSDEVSHLLSHTDIDFRQGDVVLDGQVVNQWIRTPEVTRTASQVASMAQVHEKLALLQRKMGQAKSVVMDGRDIGTNVLTDAEFKFFLTASVSERARRRFLELAEKGTPLEYCQVEQDICKRDHDDSTRELHPLRKAEDAIEVDTTGMTIQQVSDLILSQIRGM